ncbi:MAG: hypothetical protein IT423_19500, partial [Pirellulaceae bacterium]|nr:hypothetical protein [Pirellulaceae bacterium]
MSTHQRNTEPSTSELRHDWLSDRWVIIAPQRTDRPDDFARLCDPLPSSKAVDSTQHDCPFCSGRETETPPPLAVYYRSCSDAQCDPEGGRVHDSRASHNSTANGHATEPWLVRVVPNKFPAVNGVQSLKFPGMVGVEGVSSILTATTPGVAVATEPSAIEPAVVGQAATEPVKPTIDLFQARNVSGAHEVIIESPLHLCSLTQLDRQTTTLIFHAYRDRLRHWSNCLDIAYAVVFKNVGLDAGASLVHTHSQLIATNILPTDVRRSVERMELFYQTEQECLFCRMLADELEENVRIVAQTSDFVAYCPFASRLPSLVT